MDEEELRKKLKERGWRLRKVVRFKHRDRIVAEKAIGKDKGLTVTLYLKCKLEDLKWEHLERVFGG